MNRRLNRYVNYLTDNNPSPFCDYILSKELLKEDFDSVKAAYEWATRFKLYAEIRDEQLPDGSWGGFDTAQQDISKKKKYKATARAISRLLDLSLDNIGDPMVNKVIDVMKKYLSGELPDPEHYGKENIGKRIWMRRQFIQYLGYFEPENHYVTELRKSTAEQFKKFCEDGNFSDDKWRELDNTIMLCYGNVIDDNLQRILLSHEWGNDGWAVWVRPSDIKSPEDSWFIFWIKSVERLQNFSLFGEFMQPEVMPYLYSLCEKIVNDRNNQMNITINNYFYHHGQYSESRTTVQKKKNDLLLQIIRVLNKIPE